MMAEKSPGRGGLRKVISFRLDEQEYEAWMNKVAESGGTASSFFRKAVLQNKTVVRAQKHASFDKKQLLYQTNIIIELFEQYLLRHGQGDLDALDSARFTLMLSRIQQVLVKLLRHAD